MRWDLIRFGPSALLSLLTGKTIFLTFTAELFAGIMLCFLRWGVVPLSPCFSALSNLTQNSFYVSFRGGEVCWSLSGKRPHLISVWALLKCGTERRRERSGENMLTLGYKNGQGQTLLWGLIIRTDKMNSKECISDSLLGMRIMKGMHKGPKKEQRPFSLSLHILSLRTLGLSNTTIF